jgi:Fe-S-cluster containining protein
MGGCMRCGRCCTRFGVCVTPFDIMRISEATGEDPILFVMAIEEPDKRERTEPSVVISGVRSLMVLRWKAARVCRFFTKDGCSVYAHRPSLCRSYPFVSKEGRLAEVGSRQCPAGWKSGDGYLADAKRYSTEIERYRKIAAEWDSGPGGDLETFLSFIKAAVKNLGYDG